jgi:hypothetical protein
LSWWERCGHMRIAGCRIMCCHMWCHLLVGLGRAGCDLTAAGQGVKMGLCPPEPNVQ